MVHCHQAILFLTTRPIHYQYRPEKYREEIELLRSHVQNARRQAPKASCFLA